MKLLLKAALTLSLLAGAASAEPADDWVTIKAGRAFRFEAPPDLKSVPVQGIDSFVGRYRADRFALQFDYGLYSNSLQSLREDPRYEAETFELDGRQAVILTGPADGGDGFCAAMYVVVRESPKTALEMDGCANGHAGMLQLQRLFRSVRFISPDA